MRTQIKNRFCAALLAAIATVLLPAAAVAQDVAARESDWRTEAIHDQNTGNFAYCATEARYDNGLVLIFARTAFGETNIVLGFPGGDLAAGSEYNITVGVDDSISRDFTAEVPHSELLIVPTGTDAELYLALKNGNVMRLESDADITRFALSGTGQALGDLAACSEGYRQIAEDLMRLIVFPPALRGVLVAAGLNDAEPIRIESESEEERVADHAWRLGPILGGVIQRDLPEDWTGTRAEFDALIDTYISRLRSQCDGTFDAGLGVAHDLGVAGFLQKGDVSCDDGSADSLAAVLMYVDADGFTVFFHEGAGEGVAIAKQARDNIASVLTRVAEMAEEAAEQNDGAAP